MLSLTKNTDPFIEPKRFISFFFFCILKNRQYDISTKGIIHTKAKIRLVTEGALPSVTKAPSNHLTNERHCLPFVGLSTVGNIVPNSGCQFHPKEVQFWTGTRLKNTVGGDTFFPPGSLLHSCQLLPIAFWCWEFDEGQPAGYGRYRSKCFFLLSSRKKNPQRSPSTWGDIVMHAHRNIQRPCKPKQQKKRKIAQIFNNKKPKFQEICWLTQSSPLATENAQRLGICMSSASLYFQHGWQWGWKKSHFSLFFFFVNLKLQVVYFFSHSLPTILP